MDRPLQVLFPAQHPPPLADVLAGLVSRMNLLVLDAASAESMAYGKQSRPHGAGAALRGQGRPFACSFLAPDFPKILQ